MTAGFRGFSLKGIHNRSWKHFFKDLYNEIMDDNVFNGSAALGFYLTLAIFPGLIFLLNLLPYLPIPDQREEIYSLLRQAMPSTAASALTDTVKAIVSEKRQGLLSFGALFTLWAATSGMAAIIDQLNLTYDVKDGRSYFRVRAIAAMLTVIFGSLVVVAFSLILAGDWLHKLIDTYIGLGPITAVLFDAVRWLIIFGTLASAFAFTYYYGPDVKQKFRFVTPGSILGVVVLAITSLAFKLYVEHFGNYNATYGSIGAVIVLMLWLNITGLVLLVGSEVNALVEHYSPDGKIKGEKKEGDAAPEVREAIIDGRAPLPINREGNYGNPDGSKSA